MSTSMSGLWVLLFRRMLYKVDNVMLLLCVNSVLSALIHLFENIIDIFIELIYRAMHIRCSQLNIDKECHPYNC